MDVAAPRPAHDPWCDVDGTHISLFGSRVEQVAENPEHEGLFSRLHQQGQVLGRGLDLIYIRFDGESQLLSLRPHLVRLLPDEPDRY
ncbi:MAG: hypothetical protein ACRDRY_12030 [Pseudonocardiaceae bacterium]